MLKTGAIIKQFRHEDETWKRMLAFLTDENINLKTRLSAILKDMDVGDGSFLERIEYFHNRLIKEDEIIGYLRLEITEQDNLLIRDIFENGELLKEVKKKQKKIRKELETAEIEFNKLKFELNSYFAEIL